MKNPLYIGLLFACLLSQSVHCLFAQSSPSQKKKSPNIIFILADDLGFGDLGVFFQQQRQKNNNRSEPWHFTPQLDKLAATGATLMQHYTSAPVCVPARASLLTGLHQGHTNVRNNQFDKAIADNYTLGNVLQKVGYTTAAIGKWGVQGDNRWDKNGDSWPAKPLNRGFDYFFGYMRHVDGHEHYPKEGLYRGTKELYQNDKEISKDLDKCYTTDLWTAAAKQFVVDHLKSAKADAPFFLYLAYDAPHAVLELPTQAYPTGGGLKGGVQWLGKPGKMINTASGEIDSWMHPDYKSATYDDDKNSNTAEVPWPDTYKRYATSVRRIDDGVGDIMQLLKDLRIDSNTIVVFTSDNGPSIESYLPEKYVDYKPTFFNSFGPFDGIKRDTWEGGIHMPAIVSWPAKIPAHSVVNSPNAFYDWLPTFCVAAGYSPPAESDGVNLLPVLTGEGKPENSLIYIEYEVEGKTPDFLEFDPAKRGRKRGQMQVIRLDGYQGIRYDIKSQSDDFEIYDVMKDPKQTVNLAMRPEFQSLQQKMKDRVLQVRLPDTSAKRPYDEELVPASNNVKADKGLNWQLFEGTFPWIPKASGLKPSVRGVASIPSVELLNLKKKGVIRFEGFIRVPTDGAYTFFLKAGSNALLRIHETNVIDADYGCDNGSQKKGSILLKEGFHPITIYYKKTQDKNDILDLEWQGPGINRQQIGSNYFFKN